MQCGARLKPGSCCQPAVASGKPVVGVKMQPWGEPSANMGGMQRTCYDSWACTTARSFSPTSDSDFLHWLYFFFSSQSTTIIKHKQDMYLYKCTWIFLVFCKNLWMFKQFSSYKAGCFHHFFLFLRWASLLSVLNSSSSKFQAPE